MSAYRAEATVHLGGEDRSLVMNSRAVREIEQMSRAVSPNRSFFVMIKAPGFDDIVNILYACMRAAGERKITVNKVTDWVDPREFDKYTDAVVGLISSYFGKEDDSGEAEAPTA